ncbi:hypothetical protein N7474_008006 [Penicillium riverlandense]|uniref:uncharacterized protein n=1 Tax=Penicillium riverlandense TaxID=1903569 RepID=UPI0025481D94|nr:uncharacterized protein N7474_008006 [Penicillium riverlandense]KAJ5811705.1 hypothetical protein N7474_008006 [Penicillium riverlandense]
MPVDADVKWTNIASLQEYNAGTNEGQEKGGLIVGAPTALTCRLPLAIADLSASVAFTWWRAMARKLYKEYGRRGRRLFAQFSYWTIQSMYCVGWVGGQ